uniref:Uncharacterized protein TCIL3000_7_3930 n=1 Tax=Trypanosoma congolense (strain IL3000) TaxID=1068625 RepID=G0UQB8_TRYCI|nr:unnamed protein product [Trypanosoma congolense IL3000]
MRLSYADQLIQLDQQRRKVAYGRDTKRRHMKIVAVIAGVLYTITRVTIWLYPRDVTHAWIDNVLVEVVEDSMLDQACDVFGCVFVVSSVFFMLLSLSRGEGKKEARQQRWTWSFNRQYQRSAGEFLV